MKPMTELRPQDFLRAQEIVECLIHDREIHFQLTGEKIDRDNAQRHFNERAALVLTSKLLLDEGERLLEAT